MVPQNAAGLTGVEEHGERPLGFPRNLRDPDVSTADPDGGTGTDNSLAPGRASAVEGNELRAQRWYRLATLKRVETGDGESERPIVSMKRGNRPSWTPWRKGDAAS